MDEMIINSAITKSFIARIITRELEKKLGLHTKMKLENLYFKIENGEVKGDLNVHVEIPYKEIRDIVLKGED